MLQPVHILVSCIWPVLEPSKIMRRRKHCLKKLVKPKMPYGCFVEGDLFYNGWGVEQDYLEAHSRFSKGCQQGYPSLCAIG